MPGIEHILINPFLNATKRSPAKALTLGSFTDARLGGDGKPPEIVALYNVYHPVFEQFKALMLARNSRRSEGISLTAAQQILIDDLSRRIKDWALRIEYVHRRETPEYLAFLPRGRRPFRHGKIEARRAAVSSLAKSLQGKAAFSALHAEVQAFANELEAAIGGAAGAQSLKGTSSKELENGRIELCHALFAVLGALINMYPDKPEKAKTYFDIATMHRHRSRKTGAKQAPEPGEIAK
jgi:hypothetical protein